MNFIVTFLFWVLFAGFSDTNFNNRMDDGEPFVDDSYTIFVYPPSGPFRAVTVEYPAGEWYPMEHVDGTNYIVLSRCAETDVVLGAGNTAVYVPSACPSIVLLPFIGGNSGRYSLSGVGR